MLESDDYIHWKVKKRKSRVMFRIMASSSVFQAVIKTGTKEGRKGHDDQK